jgi:dynein heavy chain
VPAEDFEKRLLHGAVSEAVLEQLFTAAAEVFVPLLCNPKNQVGWPEVVTREVVDNMHKFSAAACASVGLTKGQTILPVPPVSLPADEPRKRSSDGATLLPASLSVSSIGSASASAAAAASGTAAVASAALQRDLELIHIMEAAVVTWTRQIKGVLRTEPDQELKEGGVHPGPLSELAFWDRKAASLAALLEQLSSPRILRVMELLKSTRSTFYPAFEKLCVDVQVASQECNDNVRYLAPLTKCVLTIAGACVRAPAPALTQ